MTSRRVFLGRTPPAVAWAAFAGKIAAAPSRSGEEFWLMVKSHFPLSPDIVYLNAANVCPASRLVMDRYLELLRDFHANPSFQNRQKYVLIQERVREKAAALLGVTADEIAITRNTSEASNTVVQGLDLKPGEEVLITSHNHPSNNDAWKVRARRHGFEVKTVRTPVLPRTAAELTASIEEAITPRTRVIAVTHVTNTCGLRYPVREIGALARARDIHFHVDGAQSFGALQINLREIGCDSYAASAHKWSMGPLEAGILYVRAASIPRVWPSVVTAGWSDTIKGARKFEVFGQRDDPRVAALEPALDFLNMLGMPAVEARLLALVTHAKRGLRELPNVRLKSNTEPELCGGVVRFEVQNVPVKRAYDTLWERHKLAIAMTASGDYEGLRFSPHVYNTLDDIDRAVAAVRSLA
jgi:selenocysteine lyase/cysteine desulfurase